MMRLRRADERGRGQHGGWLDSRHTFSFANYYDPDHMGFRALRVINDDQVAGGAGFPAHPHRSMEILSYVVDGALEHRDSMGNGSIIRPGELQRMSAGSGVTHSEYNHHPDRPVRFLQIWVSPEAAGGEPGYEQRDFGDERNGKLRLIASSDGREGSLRVKQDMSLYAAVLAPGDRASRDVRPDRYAWVQVVRGEVKLGDQTLREGDGAALEQVESVDLEAVAEAEVLLFDLA